MMKCEKQLYFCENPVLFISKDFLSISIRNYLMNNNREKGNPKNVTKYFSTKMFSLRGFSNKQY